MDGKKRLHIHVCACVHTHAPRNIQPLKSKAIVPFVTPWIDLEGTMLGEMSERQKQTIISLTCGI